MPKVGIFFFIDGQILIDAVPVEHGERTAMTFSMAATMNSGKGLPRRVLLKGASSHGLTTPIQGEGSSISRRERDSAYIMIPV